MSLSFTAEHLAWQQRIARESQSTHKFYQCDPRGQLEAQKDLSRKRSWSSTQSNGLPVSNPNLLRDTPFHHSPPQHEVVSNFSPYRHLGSPSKSSRSPMQYRSRKSMTIYRGPAEVRGKYAPPPDLRVSTSVERKTAATNALGRPATAGTLKRSLRGVNIGVQADPKTPTRKAIVLEGTSRPRSANVTRGRGHGLAETYRPGNQTVTEEKPAELPEAVAEPEAPRSPPIEKTAEERPATGASIKTFATQRRYIEELERLLREERKRRILAEAQLQS